MTSEQVLIDFSLPNTPDTLKFLKLSQSEKMKAVALGIKFLTSGNHQLQSWDNSQWEERIEQIQQEKHEIILALEEKLQLEHVKRQKLIKSQKEELNSIVEGVRNRTESKYLSEIACLNDKMERLQNKISLQENEKTKLYKTINDEFYSKILSKEQLWEAKNERIRKEYEEKLERTGKNCGMYFNYQTFYN